METDELTIEQKKWIRSLQVVMGKAPKDLWMFVASGEMCVMHYKGDPYNQQRAISRNSDTGMDQDYIACSIATPMDLDGGDW